MEESENDTSDENTISPSPPSKGTRRKIDFSMEADNENDNDNDNCMSILYDCARI